MYAESLDEVLDELAVGKVFLLGHSYGGFVAQYYAAHRPDRVAGLVLYESSPVTGEEQGAESVRQLQAFVERNDGNPELPAVLGALQPVGSITNDEQLTVALRGLLPAYFAHYWERESEFAAFRERTRVEYVAGELIQDRELLAGISVPTLVIGGRYDVICGERWAREIHDVVRDSRLVILEESGHLGHVEEPERFDAAVLGFVTA